MKIYDNYIIILASLLLITSVIFAVLDETRLDLCFSVFLIEALVLNELCIYLNPKAKRSLNTVNYVLFAGFALIVANKVIEIIWGFDAMAILSNIIKMRVMDTLKA